MDVPGTIIESVCLTASLSTFFQKKVPLYLRFFPFFLFLTVVIEVGAPELKGHVDLYLLYNFFTAFEFEFYLLVTMFIIKSPLVKKIILGIIAVYALAVVINVFYIQVHHFHTITYSIGCLLIVGACIYYLFEIFQTPQAIKLWKEPAFWICTALLFYYCCTFPLVGLWNQFHFLPRVIVKNIRTILTLLNILLYSLFSLAFICRWRMVRE
jgi:hypothetical protein